MKKITSLLSVFICICMLSACTATNNSSSEPTDSSTIVEIVYDYESKEEQTSSKPDTTTSAESSSQQTATTVTEAESSQITSSTVIGNDIANTAPIARTPEAVLRQLEIGKYEYRDAVTGYNLPYCLILPKDYDASEKYPVLFYLHGAGERGSDNKIHLNNMMGDLYFYNRELMDTAIVVCPQCPAGDWWNFNLSIDGSEPTGALAAAMRLLFDVMERYSADSDRVYVMGLSMGGFATWTVLENYSDFFAAGVPICGWSDTFFAQILVDVPIWIYHGTADNTVSFERSEEMYNAIRNAGGEKVRFTRLYGVDHDAWDYADKDTQMIEWLFSQKLSDR